MEQQLQTTRHGVAVQQGEDYMSMQRTQSSMELHLTARGASAAGGALYVKARDSIVDMSRFINNTAPCGAAWYILFANISAVNHNATSEGIQRQDLNATLYDGICGEIIVFMPR